MISIGSFNAKQLKSVHTEVSKVPALLPGALDGWTQLYTRTCQRALGSYLAMQGAAQLADSLLQLDRFCAALSLSISDTSGVLCLLCRAEAAYLVFTGRQTCLRAAQLRFLITTMWLVALSRFTYSFVAEHHPRSLGCGPGIIT